MFTAITIRRGKRTLYVSNHPQHKKAKVKFHPNPKKAHVFSSSHIAKNIRDGLLTQGARLVIV